MLFSVGTQRNGGLGCSRCTGLHLLLTRLKPGSVQRSERYYEPGMLVARFGAGGAANGRARPFSPFLSLASSSNWRFLSISLF